MQRLIILISVFILINQIINTAQDYTLDFDDAGTWSGTYINAPIPAGTISGNYWTRLAIARDSLYGPNYDDPIRLENSASLIGNPLAFACTPMANGVGNEAREGQFASLPDTKILLITNSSTTQTLDIAYWDRGNGPLFGPGFKNNSYRFACNRPDDGAIPQLPADTSLLPGESLYLIRNGLVIEPFVFCSAGQYTDGTQCIDCGAGFFQADPGAESCEPCEVGRYQDQPGQSSCLDCTAGRYQDQPGQSSCLVCPAGTYQDQRGQRECLTCPPGFTSEEGATICSIAIPTVSQWALIILAISLSTFGLVFIRKRKLKIL